MDPRSGCQAHVARAMAPPKAPKLLLCGLFSDTCKISQNLSFSETLLSPRMGLGDDLVTIRVLEHPGGPTWWPLGPCSPSHRPPKSFKIAVCRWFNGIWWVHELLKQFSTLCRSKMEIFAKCFFDIVTTYNDEICYVKHVLAPLCVFFTLFGCWGGGARGLGHNLLMQFSSLSSSRMEISETDFFDTVTIQNDQISYVKHVLAPLYVFFKIFGCWGGGGAPKGSRAQPAYALFQPRQLKNGNFRN